jgi:hypothetical protein
MFKGGAERQEQIVWGDGNPWNCLPEYDASGDKQCEKVKR